MIERNLDYLMFSAMFSEVSMIEKKFEPILPIRFYKRGYLGEHGFKYYFGNPNSPKALVTAGGQDLAAMRNKGWTDEKLLQWVIEAGGIVSRLDLAVTKYIDESFFTVGDVTAWQAMGWFKGALSDQGAKVISRLLEDGGMGIETLYLGDMKKRGKRGIFRAYDKGLEWNIGEYLVTRLELEEKHENAHATAVRIADGVSIAACFRSRLDCSSDEFQEAMDSPVADISRGQASSKTEKEEKMDNRWAWLIETVAPALKDAIAHDRKVDSLDTRLIAFMAESGLLAEMKKAANLLAENKFYDKLESNELVPRESEKE